MQLPAQGETLKGRQKVLMVRFHECMSPDQLLLPLPPAQGKTLKDKRCIVTGSGCAELNRAQLKWPAERASSTLLLNGHGTRLPLHIAWPSLGCCCPLAA
jgi:hypothetical protein